MTDVAHGIHLLVKLEIRQVEPAEGDEVTHLDEPIPFGRRAGCTHRMPLVHHPGGAVVVTGGDVTVHGFRPARARQRRVSFGQRLPYRVYNLVSNEHRVHGHWRWRQRVHNRALGGCDAETTVGTFIARY